MSIVLEIKVVPSSGKQEAVLDKSGMIKIYLKSEAKNFAANNELIRFLAKALKIDRDKITILTGETTPKKRIKIDFNITLASIYRNLGIEEQKKVF